MPDNLDIFMQNSKTMRDRILADEELMGRLRVADRTRVKMQTDNPFDTKYIGLIGLADIGLKLGPKDSSRVEMSAMADLFTPDTRTPSFIVPISPIPGTSQTHLMYLIENFGGGLRDIPFDHDGRWIPFDRILEHPELKAMTEHMTAKGYTLSDFDGRRCFSVRTGNGDPEFFLTDLDCHNMDEHREIYSGASQGKGKFARLKGIHERLHREASIEL
jgi:hypothetical protein